MGQQSKISRTAFEYDALKAACRKFQDDDLEIPAVLMERETDLVSRLIATPAESSDDLAHKATVLLDWIEAQDLPSNLTFSLCEDAIRLHRANDALSGG